MTDNADERTVVSTDHPPAAAEGADATVAMSPGPQAAPDRTQMAVSVECPVCHATNPPTEVYCGDCGFLLASTPGDMPEEPTGPTAYLTDATGREFPLALGRNSVGRQNADVLLTDPTVSRQHAAIVLEEERAWIEDLGSTNGTRVNGEPLAARQPRNLKNGDEVRFGSVSLRVVLPEGFAAAPEPEPEPVETLDSPVCLVDEEGGASYPVRMGTTTIGRRSGNDIAFTGDAYVSGRHAQLDYDGETLTLTDLGSTNGTVVNGDRL
ncbi:MAG: FHA domain-containing protein, partial [Armatimonadota bacterium]|nr:FHA domain-containing protein [Armatimonadota bacterium]